jgi:hypothetical protein
MLGVAALPSLVQAFSLLALPESPKWLASKGRAAEAREALAKLQPGSAVVEASSVSSAAGGAYGSPSGVTQRAPAAAAAAAEQQQRGPEGAGGSLSRRARGGSGSSGSEEERGGGWGEAPAEGGSRPGSPTVFLEQGRRQGRLEEERAPLRLQQESSDGGGGSPAAQHAQQPQEQAQHAGSKGRQRWAERRRQTGAAWRLLKSGPVLRQLHIGETYWSWPALRANAVVCSTGPYVACAAPHGVLGTAH